MKHYQMSAKLEFYSDNRYLSVKNSWAPDVFPFEAFIMGREPFMGVSAKRIGESAKVELKSYAASTDTANRYVPVDGKDIPIYWFNKETYNAIQLEGRIRFLAMTGEGKYRIIFEHELSYPEKLLLLARTSRSREFWSARMSTLISYKNYCINCCVNTEEDIVMPPKYKFGIKEEHALDGFYKLWADNSLNTIYQDDGVYCFEAPKKAIARDSRLVDAATSIFYGNHRVLVIDDASHPDIRDWFVTGSCYVPMSWIETRGPSRIISSFGLKATTAPMPLSMHEAFGDCIVVSKASWKTGYNGLISALTGRSPEDMIGMTDIDARLVLACSDASTVYSIDGVNVTAWELDSVPVNVTNLYGLYGLRTKEEDDSEDIKDEESSFYLEAISEIKKDPDFDLMGHIWDAIVSERVSYARHSIKIKTMEMTVASFSYGQGVANEWIKEIIRVGKIRHEEVMDRQVGAISYKEYDLVDLTKIINTVYQGVQINPGSFDPDNLKNSTGTLKISPESGATRLDVILNGDGFEWEGLLGESPKRFTIGGFKFYIPGGNIMKDFIYKEDGSNRMFFSGPASEFLKLLISARHSKTNWSMKFINHNISLQRALLGENVDQFKVEGGNFVLLPAPWLDKDQVIYLNKKTGVTGKALSVKNGDRVTFSKMPVLFDKAIADVYMLTGVPKHLFGEVSDKFVLAMRNMMFCNTDLMLTHQNDTDGDTGRISLTGGILPVFTDVAEHMKPWVSEYKEDEYDLKLKFKAYEKYSIDEMDVAVKEAMTNKQYIGRATNDLFFLSYLLELFVASCMSMNSNRPFITTMRNTYSMVVQSLVRGIKHTGGGDLIKTVAVSNMFRDNMKDIFWNGINEAMLLHAGEGWSGSIDTFRLWVEDNLVLPTINPNKTFSPLSARRVRKTGSIRLEQCHFENQIKVLDMFTNSFIIGAESAMPSFRMSDAQSTAVANKIMNNNDQYKMYLNKYLLLGQDMSNYCEYTTHGMLMTAIKSRNNSVSLEDKANG